MCCSAWCSWAALALVRVKLPVGLPARSETTEARCSQATGLYAGRSRLIRARSLCKDDTELCDCLIFSLTFPKLCGLSLTYIFFPALVHTHYFSQVSIVSTAPSVMKTFPSRARRVVAVAPQGAIRSNMHVSVPFFLRERDTAHELFL